MRIRSPGATILAAVAFPILLLLGFQLFTLVNAHREEIERAAGARTVAMADIADAQAGSDLKLAKALASAASLKGDDIAAAYARAMEFAKISSDWRTVKLSDPVARTELFDLRRPFDRAPHPITPLVALAAKAPLANGFVGGIDADDQGAYAIMVHVPVRRGNALRYILTVEIDPAALQAEALARFPAGSTAALVDRQGRFLARTMDFSRRVGRPGSTYLQAAVRRGGHGFYRGYTLEGLSNYTAYATAPTTGWSAHEAVDSALIDGPRRWSYLIWAAVGLGCLLASAGLVISALRDLAQKRRDDERHLQAQKMEAVGQLTGGIAHDFNNLLTAVIGSLDLVLRRGVDDARTRRYLEGALDAATRGAKLTSRLLAFSRTQRLEMDDVDVATVFEELQPLLEQSLGPRIEIVRFVDSAARWVRTDRSQLELALLNIALNARDAMPDGGRLTFSTTPRDRIGRNLRAAVEISVRDTGVGMTAAVAARALEPFFTTKAIDKGTGLGLAQVYAMVQQSQGEVSLTSAPNEGAVVSLVLPAAHAPADAVAPAVQDRASTRDDDLGEVAARILILDDDDSVREVMVENLRARGHIVFQASTGEDALSALSEIDPDLFILDFLMPGLNGAQVAAQARETRPSQKLLIVSGHLDSHALDAAPRDVRVLRKPFDGVTLAQIVNEVLTGE